MGCSTSRIEDEEVVSLCKERKRWIKKTVEQRYALASAHVAYIQALKNIGTAFEHFAQQEMLLESLFPTSHTTPEPVVLPRKSSSTFQSPSPSPPQSPIVEGVSSPPPPESLASHDAISPPFNDSPPRMKYMRLGRIPAMTFEDRPPSPDRGTLRSYSTAPQARVDQSAGTSRPPMPPSPSSSHNRTFPPPPPSPPLSSSWDFFNPFSPLDDPYHFPEQRGLRETSKGDREDLKLVREEEGIPDLEDWEQGEERRGKGKKQVQVEENISEAWTSDSEQNYPDNASVPAVDTAGEKPVATSNADSFREAPTKPSTEAVGQSITESVGREIPARDIEEASKAIAEKVGGVDILAKDKDDVADKETHSKKEDAAICVAHGPRNLLCSMKDIECQFARASESGKEVSRMLETNKIHYPSIFTETKEPSSRVLNIINWHRSTSSRSSSSKPPLASNSKDDIDDSSSDFVEDFCMISGSHASTLERLYAWERKLYDEVKAGEYIKRAYEKKCLQLRRQEAKGEGFHAIDKTRAVIKDLHSRIRVAIQAVDSVSKRIQKLRDEELQPQVVELIQGLMRMWKVMLECHETQSQIVLEANAPGSATPGRMTTESHRQATIELENELHNWYLSFGNWKKAQNDYVHSLHEWLFKCISRNPENWSGGRRLPFSPRNVGAPTVVIICDDWSRAFEQMQEKEVVDAIRNLAVYVRALWTQQDEQQQQKTTENFAKGLDRRVLSVQKVERRVLGNQLSSVEKQKSNPRRAGTPMADQNLLSVSFKAKHHKSMQHTHHTTLNSLHMGLKCVFEALTEFARKSHNAYQELHVNSEKARLRPENGKMSHI